jgi:hypothetical protein
MKMRKMVWGMLAGVEVIVMVKWRLRVMQAVQAVVRCTG